MTDKALVVAVGNPLMGDDGVGPAVLTALRQEKDLANVRLAEAGTDATALLQLWQGEALVILVDALVTGARPGTVHVLAKQEFLRLSKGQWQIHALSLPACLEWVFLAEPRLAESTMVLVGVEPQFVGPGEELSHFVRMAIPQAVKAVRKVLREAGEFLSAADEF